MTGGKCETAPRSYEEQKSTSEQASHTSIPHKNPPQADIVYFDSHVFYDECEPIEHTTFMEHAKMTKEGLITPKEWLKYVKNSRLGFFWFSKEGLINFKFLQKIGLLFMPSIIHEDHHFGVLLFARAKNIYVLPQKLYEYRIRANSIMNHSGTSLELGTPARYLQGIYDAFERLDDAKAYHKAASWVLTNLAFIELIKDKNLPRAVRKGVKAHLLPRHCEWALAVLKAPYDPWGVKTKANIKLMKKYKDNLLMTIIKRAL